MNDDRLRVPRWLSTALLVATLGLVVWLIARDRPSLDPLRDLSAGALVLIMVLQFLYLIPESYRQEIVIESSSARAIPSFAWFRIFIVGRFLNTLVPQGGNVYRALRLRSDYGVAVTRFGGGMAAFIVMSVVASLFTAAPLLAWQSPSTTVAGLPASLVVLLAGIVVTAVPVAAAIVARRLGSPRGESAGFLGTVSRVAQATLAALTDQRLLVKFLGVWGVTVVVVVALYRAVFDATGWDLGIGEAVAIYALLQVSSFIVLTPGNLGIQELGLAALAALFGIPAASGALAAALIRVTGWIAIAIPSLAFGTRDIREFLRSRRSPA